MNPAVLDPFPQPDANDSDTVSTALEALKQASDESTATDACDAFLWSVGDNHAGTFYPVVLAVLPEIERILVGSNRWAQRAVMEALIDLGGTFAPEAGHETYQGAPVQATLRTFIQSMRRHLLPLVEGDDACARSAADLLELIADQTA